jgi:CBS domain-containing protein
MRVADLMITNVVSCSAGEALSCAAQRMWDRDLGWLPVVDARQRVVGVVTDRDICMAAFTQGRRLTDIPVSAAMARQVASCTEREDILPVERRMAARQVRRMPVVDDDDVLIGAIALADLARAFGQRGAVTAGAVAEVLAGVGEARHTDDEAEHAA